MIKGSDKTVGTIADFTNMQIVKLWIELGRAGNGRAAEDNELAGSFRSPCDVMDLWCLICMPLTKTKSAQAKSPAVAGVIFSSMNRTSHDGGRYAAMRRSPCGGMNARTRGSNR